MSDTLLAPDTDFRGMSAYEHYAIGLRCTHTSLRRNLDKIIAVSSTETYCSAAFQDFILLFIESLSGHHQVEDSVTFPALRAGANEPVAERFFARCDADHDIIAEHIEQLGDAARRSNAPAIAICEAAKALRAVALPHFELEEEFLTPAVLANLITQAGLSAAEKAAMAEHRKGSVALLLLYIHSFNAADQRILFSEQSWFFRKVLVKLFWRNTFAKYRPFAFNPAVNF